MAVTRNQFLNDKIQELNAQIAAWEKARDERGKAKQERKDRIDTIALLGELLTETSQAQLVAEWQEQLRKLKETEESVEVDIENYNAQIEAAQAAIAELQALK